MTSKIHSEIKVALHGIRVFIELNETVRRIIRQLIQTQFDWYTQETSVKEAL